MELDERKSIIVEGKNQSPSCAMAVLTNKPRPLNLMELPAELHLEIATHLIYPDALALKHTNTYFRSLIYTGIHLKIEWLIMRRQLHLPCPQEGPCKLNTDLEFCRGSIKLLMERRRRHDECEKTQGGRGCLVFGTKACEQKMGPVQTVIRDGRAWLRRNIHIVLCVFVGLVSVLYGLLQRAPWAVSSCVQYTKIVT
jgi:hypothetical protein